MANKDQFTANDFIRVIPGTGGIVSTIAKAVGCDWHTAKKYIDNYATVKQAYDDECEHNLDIAETVIMNNIRKGDSGDAKWYLAKKGKHRGYVDRQEVDLNPDGKEILIRRVGIDPDKL